MIKPILILTAICTLTACQKKIQTSTSPSKNTEETSTTSTPDAEPDCCQVAPDATETSPDSIYVIDSEWTTQLGNPFHLSDLTGKIQIITMGYSTCKFACPRLMADMQAIQNAIPANLADQVHYCFFSIDPDRDTPERLTEYSKEHKLDPNHWTLLTSSQDNIQELAVVLGTKYSKISPTDFAHSNLITVLNQKGEIIHRTEGLGTDPKPAIQAIIKATRNPSL